MVKPVAYLVKDAVPNYLSGLPIPETFGGWFRLGFRDWLSLVPPTAALAGITYLTYRAFRSKSRGTQSDVEDVGERYWCRCWRSKNWPFCDGTHALL